MYTKGDLAEFDNDYEDPRTGDPVDPTTVVFRYETPAGIETTLTYGVDAALTKRAAGKYTARVDLNASGTWNFQWKTTGTYQGVDEFTREVAASQFS